MAKVSATFTTTAPEVVTVSRAILYRGWSYWVLLAVVVGLPLGGAVWCACDLADRALLVSVALVGVAFWYLSPWIYVLSARRGAPNPDGPFTFTLGDESVLVEAPHARVEWKWTALHHVVETKAHVLLFVARHQAQFVPKRALDADSLARVRSMLAERTSERS